MRTKTITFHNADIKFTLPQNTRLKIFMLASIVKASGKNLELTYIFCSDKYLLKVNRQFLKHDYYTDIITFPLLETERRIEAEIYISIDRIKANAKKMKVEFITELHRVMIHGILHLLGYNDKTVREKKEMREKEEEWLELFIDG